MMPLENNHIPQETRIAVDMVVADYLADKIGCRTMSDKIKSLLTPFATQAPEETQRIIKSANDKVWKAMMCC